MYYYLISSFYAVSDFIFNSLSSLLLLFSPLLSFSPPLLSFLLFSPHLTYHVVGSDCGCPLNNVLVVRMYDRHLEHTHTRTLTRVHTLTYTYSLTLTYTHIHSLTHSHSHTVSHTHLLTLTRTTNSLTVNYMI